MKKATDVFEWVNAFTPANFLQEEEREFYVPFYEDLLNEIRDEIIFNTSNRKLCIFVNGQKGTGKTTALSFLPTDVVKNKHYVINFITTEHFNLEDAHISYFLIQLNLHLLKLDESGQLEDEFRKQLQRLKDIANKKYTIETTNSSNLGGDIGVKASFGIGSILKFLNLFDLKTDISANIKGGKEYKETIKEAFEVLPDEVFELTNEIISRFREYNCPNKEILLIVNELDHIRSKGIIEEFFVTRGRYISELNCKKVVSIPFIGSFEIPYGNVYTFCLKTKKNPLPGAIIDKESEKTVDDNVNKFFEVVAKRADSKLYDKTSIQLAIDQSGGVLRQFVEILYGAGIRARRNRATKITKEDIEDGLDRVRQNMEMLVLSTNRINTLEFVRKAYAMPNENNEVFIDCLLNNLVILYQNKPNWYEVNPLIERSVSIYAKQAANENK